jgi:hypothetical protein
MGNSTFAELQPAAIFATHQHATSIESANSAKQGMVYM